MFIKNTQKKDVRLNSFEGYWFSVPPGVSAIWTPAGEAMLKVHKVESKGGKDKYGLDNGSGLPALFEATEAQWKVGGRKLADTGRFKMKAHLIPRASLIKTALARGISANRCTEFQLDPQIDNETIIEEINALPVPEEIKRPVNIENDEQET